MPSGHVPGAVHVDWTSDLNDQLRRDYITRDGFEQLMSRIGATPDTTVVFYGDKNNWWACYAFWVFQLFGHTNARVMDGGRIKWEKEGAAADPRRCRRTRGSKYTAQDRTDAPNRAFRDDVLRPHAGAGTARGRPQPGGVRRHPHAHARLSRTKGALRGGHIPGAKSIPWARAVNPEDGTFKTAAELRKIYCDEKQLSPIAADHRLLPHRRTQQPHLVRAEVPARLRERPQLRRIVDRVGQHGECAY